MSKKSSALILPKPFYVAAAAVTAMMGYGWYLLIKKGPRDSSSMRY